MDENFTMSLTIDEIRWLQFCRAMDSAPASSRSNSPSPIFKDSQDELSLNHDSLTLSSRSRRSLKGADGPVYSYRAMHPMPTISASVPIVGNGLGTQDPPLKPCLQLIPADSSPSVQGPVAMSSSGQEWIYRRPNKSPRHYQRPLQTAMSISSRVCSRHSRDQHEQNSYSQTINVASRNESITNPFWSTILHTRSHSERSIHSLKAKPSRPQLIISRPFTPLPTISSSPVETSFISAKQSLLRTPSITSTASTASTSNMSKLGTPTISSFSHNARRHRHKKESYAFLSGSLDSRRTRPDLNYPLLSSSCPPNKSILTRSSTMLTKGSHTTSTQSGCSPNKSVKFVEIPTIHYASTDHLDFKSMGEIRGVHDVSMGIDVEGMDLGHDSYIDGPETKVAELYQNPETVRKAHCSAPVPERVTTLKRLMHLKQKPEKRSNGPLLTSARRPAISGPYALGTVQGVSTGISSSPIPLSTIPCATIPQQTNQPHFPPTNSPDNNRLRGAPSMESVKSTCSAAARSIRSVGGVKTTANVRGFRSWIEKNLGPNMKVIFGAG